MILALGAATAGIAVGALFVAVALAAVLIRVLDGTDTERPRRGDEDEFSVKGEPAWWPDFERRFAEYAAAAGFS